MKPSEIKDIIPVCSVFHRAQYEWVAQGIAQIQTQTGDTFRKVDWEEWVSNNPLSFWGSVESQQKYFDAVQPYLESEERVRKFSRAWDL